MLFAVTVALPLPGSETIDTVKPKFPRSTSFSVTLIVIAPAVLVAVSLIAIGFIGRISIITVIVSQSEGVPSSQMVRVSVSKPMKSKFGV